MPCFLVEFRNDENPKRQAEPLRAKLSPESKDIAHAIGMLQAVARFTAGADAGRVCTITALEDLETPSINPCVTSPIKSGDVVWRNWFFFWPDDGPDSPSGTARKDAAKEALQAYKPLWEPGPGYDDIVALYDL